MELYSGRISSSGRCFGVKGITKLHVKHQFYIYDSRIIPGNWEDKLNGGAVDGRRDIACRKVKQYFSFVT